MWTKIANLLKRNFLHILEKLLGRPEITPDKVDHKSIQRILVIRQHDQLGDFLLSTPVLRALRNYYPDAYIALLTRSYTNDVAKNNQYINKNIFLHDSGYDYSVKWFINFRRQLRAGYDLTIVLNTVSHSLSSDILAYLSRARYTLGSEIKIFPGCKRNFFYNLIAPYDKNEKHQTERNLDITRYIGIDADDKTEIMTITEPEKIRANQLLKESGITRFDNLIGIHPGAGKINNRWPVENFAEIANYFHKQHQKQFLVTWGPNEHELGDRLLKLLKFEPVIIINKSLRELAAIISRLSFFLCNDTGVMHLAASLNIPLIAIFGPTNIDLWKPLGKNFIAIQGENGNCQSVTVSQVKEEMLELFHDNH